MRSRKRAFWIACIIGGLVLALGVAVMSILLRPPAYPSITLSDGRLFSFAGVTVGDQPLLESSNISRVFWEPVVSTFPSSKGFFRKLGITQPWHTLPGAIGPLKKEDVSFWVLTEHSDGNNIMTGFSSDEKWTINGVDILIRDSVTKESVRPTRQGAVSPSPWGDMSYSWMFFRGLRKKSKAVDIILSRENDQGISEELATWEIEIP